jgi:hypothetical protein
MMSKYEIGSMQGSVLRAGSRYRACTALRSWGDWCNTTTQASSLMHTVKFVDNCNVSGVPTSSMQRVLAKFLVDLFRLGELWNDT